MSGYGMPNKNGAYPLLFGFLSSAMMFLLIISIPFIDKKNS